MGKMVQTEISNGRESMKQQEDINTYHSMIEEMVNRMKNRGLEATAQRNRAIELDYMIRNPTQDFAEIYAIIPRENNTITEILIDVYDEAADDCIKEVVREFREKYNHLKNLTLFKHFEECNTPSKHFNYTPQQ